MVKKYAGNFEQLGILRFETEEIKGRGQPEKFALLNEDQTYLLLTFSRNTAKVRQLKVNLVRAFKHARNIRVPVGVSSPPVPSLWGGRGAPELQMRLAAEHRFGGLPPDRRRLCCLPPQSTKMGPGMGVTTAVTALNVTVQADKVMDAVDELATWVVDPDSPFFRNAAAAGCAAPKFSLGIYGNAIAV